MSKRTAERELTKDTPDEDDSELQDQNATWQQASEEKIKQRTILKARRHGAADAAKPAETASAAPAAAPFPTFNFGLSAASTAPPATATPAPPTSTTDAAPTTSPSATVLSARAPATAAEAAGALPPTPAPAAATPNTFAQLAAKMNAGTWECPACEVRNKADVQLCAACGEPKPGAAAAATTEASSAGAITSSGFTFTPTAGTSSAFSASSSSSTAPSFSFGSAASSFPTNFSFGTTGTASAFSTASDSGPAASSGTTGLFSFSTSTPFTFNTGSTSSILSFANMASSSTSGSTGSFTVPTLDFTSSSTTPSEVSAFAEQFKDKTAESSGEETDTIHLRVQAKVFLMKTASTAPPTQQEPPAPTNGDAAPKASTDASDAADASEAAKASEAKQDRPWVDVGLGELHVNSYKVGEAVKGRLIMRADRTHRLILNTAILPHLAQSFVVHEGKYVRLASVTEDGKLQQLLLKVKGKTEATEIVDVLKKVVAMIDNK